MATVLEVMRKATWFVQYAPGHWSLNLVNIHPGLPTPYTISRVKGGYTVMLGEERIGAWKGLATQAFEDAIVGCWNDMDARCTRELGRAA